MTANQINYAKFQEDARHNLEMESYNQRMATVAERNADTSWQNVLVSANQVGVNAAQVSENMRHNVVTENQNTLFGWLSGASNVVGSIANVVRAIGKVF